MLMLCRPTTCLQNLDPSQLESLASTAVMPIKQHFNFWSVTTLLAEVKH